MRMSANKTPGQADKAGTAHAVSSPQATLQARFVDARPDAVAQRERQTMIASSPQALQMQARIAMMNGGSQAQHLQARMAPGVLQGQSGTVQMVSDADVAVAAAACAADSVDLVKRYSVGWKRKPNLSKQQVLNNVQVQEGRWTAVRDHVMLGGGGAPPTGYHSKAAGAAATSEAVGNTNPAVTGPRTVYKQWTKNRGQAGNAHLKISTFFPDGWDEAKIKACVLLSTSAAAHQMSDQLPLASPGGATFYPVTALHDPVAPP